jgi:hypothetical protein
MDVALYTGNGSTQTISGLGFSPDLVWIKARSAAYNHELYDTVRGALQYLSSSTTSAESTLANSLTAFGSDGFSVGSQVGSNGSGTTFAAWTWDAGSSTVTNTAGSITSSVRANATAGFSVVTGNFPSGDSSGTIGHGLGVKPGLIFLKSRASAEDWFVHHSALAANQALLLNSTAAIQTSTAYWNNQLPTSTVFSIGGALSNGNFVAYCFAPVAGYSSAFSITGNGSTDGPMCYLGFRPRLIIYKRTDTSGDNWFLHDTARNTYNVLTGRLFPNTSGAESTNINVMDVLSNGFKLRTNDTSWNASSGTYIGFAWAESPFNYARAR